MFYTNIGPKVKKLREQQDITQETLADKVGLTQSFISKLENGELTPSLKSLEKIAEALGVEVAELISNKEG